MDSFFDKIMENIFIESNLSLGKIRYIEESYEIDTYIYIAHKPNSDYFIYVNLPARVLSYVTNDIQITISSLIKNDLDSLFLINGDELYVSSSFDKNSTLIIFSTQESGVDDPIGRQVISIEEDPYFFKKQVLVVDNMDVRIIYDNFNKNINKYTLYLQKIISNPSLFNEFMNSNPLKTSNKVKEYSFVAKLYEKLPFLSLSVIKSTPEDLQNNIDKELSIYENKLCKTILELDPNNLEDWFNEITEEETDA